MLTDDLVAVRNLQPQQQARVVLGGDSFRIHSEIFARRLVIDL